MLTRNQKSIGQRDLHPNVRGLTAVVVRGDTVRNLLVVAALGRRSDRGGRGIYFCGGVGFILNSCLH